MQQKQRSSSHHPLTLRKSCPHFLPESLVIEGHERQVSAYTQVPMCLPLDAEWASACTPGLWPEREKTRGRTDIKRGTRTTAGMQKVDMGMKIYMFNMRGKMDERRLSTPAAIRSSQTEGQKNATRTRDRSCLALQVKRKLLLISSSDARSFAAQCHHVRVLSACFILI